VRSQSVTHTVFISYASSDRAVADSVCTALERAGENCWIAPRDVTPGGLYSEAIVHAIDSAKVLVLVLSQNAAASQHVLREVERASSKRHPVVSLRIDLAPIPAALEYFLNTSQWLDASATGVKRALPKLVDAVQRGVAHASDAATSPSEGARSAARTEPDVAVTGQSRQRSRLTLAAFSAITGFALAYLVVDHFWLSKRVDEQKPSVAATPTSPANPSAGLAIPDKSIAVLPFADMSAGKDQEYMSDGIAEEILNLLAQASDLKVIARTSSFAFKGERIEIAEIAKRLNVAHVVEGSVRTSGDKIRITAQLVRASDSSHLWSERYDRPMDDIFLVQDEIASAIAQALEIKLMGGQLGRREGGTQNLEAYKLYLRAVEASNEGTKVSVEAAGRYLERAIELDSNYGKAWDFLSGITIRKADLGLLDTIASYERARQLTLHALELSPELADAHAGLAEINLVFDWNWAEAEAGIKRALKIDPESLWARNTAGRLYMALGRFDEAERELEAARTRDPLEPYLTLNLGIANYLAGNYSESETYYRKLQELSPDFLWTRVYLGKTLLALGRPEAALQIVREESDESVRLLYLPIMLQAVGLNSEANEALKAQIAAWADTGAYFVAKTYAYRGDHDLAFAWLDRAYKQKDPGLVEMTGEPLLNGIAEDPRFKEFLQRIDLPDVW
jgi:TolB-like protein/Tfp pilus assembly protein PilF